MRLHEKIGVGRGDVQRLDGQHVVARHQPGSRRADIEGHPLHRLRIEMPLGGGGIPRGRCGCIGAGNQMAVQISGKSVVVAHEQLQAVKRVGAGNRERDADVGGGVGAIHLRPHVGVDVIGVADLLGIGGEQRGDFVRGQRPEPDGDLVNLALEIIPARVKDPAAADVKII